MFWHDSFFESVASVNKSTLHGEILGEVAAIKETSWMLHARSNLPKLCFLKQQSYHQSKLPCKEHAQQLPWNPSPSSYTLHGRSHAVYVVQAPVTL